MMLGLFRMTFDYYVWEDLLCVSESEEKLIGYFNEKCEYYPLLSKEKSEDIIKHRLEEAHFVIQEVLVV